MMDKSKTPPAHLGSCRYLTLHRGVLDLSIIQQPFLYHEVPNPNLTIRDFFIAVRGGVVGAAASAARAAVAAVGGRTARRRRGSGARPVHGTKCYH
jgi:hypothetical protein